MSIKKPRSVLSRVHDLIERAPATPAEQYAATLSDTELVAAIDEGRARQSLIAEADLLPGTPDAALIAVLERLSDDEVRRMTDAVLDALLAERRAP